MCFMIFFGQLDFDENGNVCATEKMPLAKAHSNLLYLISKYNLQFLKEQNLPTPQYFLTELSTTLQSVEKNDNFTQAKNELLENCLEIVQKFAASSKTEKEFVEKLNKSISVEGKKFADKFGEAKNNKQLEYIITQTAGKIFDKIGDLIIQGEEENKNKIFKNIITYNSLVNVCECLQNEKITNNFGKFGLTLTLEK